jgi:hypothetical protein
VVFRVLHPRKQTFCLFVHPHPNRERAGPENDRLKPDPCCIAKQVLPAFKLLRRALFALILTALLFGSKLFAEQPL